MTRLVSKKVENNVDLTYTKMIGRRNKMHIFIKFSINLMLIVLFDYFLKSHDDKVLFKKGHGLES